jgi:hypothetical protein
MRIARFTKCLMVGAFAGCIGISGSAWGQQVREFVDQTGQAYRETTEVVRKPVSTTTWQERRETVLVDRVTTQLAESERSVLTPVVEYQWTPRVQDWWNPFKPTTLAYQLTPVTRWEVQQQVVRTPVTYREMIPEERIVRTPQRSLDFVEEQVTRRVAIDNQTGQTLTVNGAATGAASIARRSGPIGGVQQMTDSLPRQGTVIQR